MELWQVESIIEAKEEETKDAWERTRALFYAAIAPHSKTKTTPQKAMPLPWDKESVKSRVPTKEDIERIRQKFK